MTRQNVKIPETGCFRRREAEARVICQESTVTVLHLMRGVEEISFWAEPAMQIERKEHLRPFCLSLKCCAVPYPPFLSI